MHGGDHSFILTDRAFNIPYTHTPTNYSLQYYQQQQSHHRVLDSGLKEIRFHVPTDLVGMAIGREGANVNEARKINGISSVEFDDYSSMFSVKGEVRVEEVREGEVRVGRDLYGGGGSPGSQL